MSGCNQIRNVSFVGGLSATSIAVGVELQREDQRADTTVFVGDPEEADGARYFFDVMPSQAIVRIHYLRVAALIGDAQMLRQLGAYPPQNEGDLQEFTVDQRAYVGSSCRFRYRDSLATLFVGIDRGFRRSLIHSTQFEGVLESASAPEEAETVDHPRPFARRPDGTILYFRSEGPLSEQNQR